MEYWRCIIEKYICTDEEYLKVFESIGNVETSEYEKKINIKKEYGVGEVRIVDISSLVIIYFDFILNEDLKIYYRISSDEKIKYKIILPFEGSIIAEKRNDLVIKSCKDRLVISILDYSKKFNTATMNIPKGEKYQALSINFGVQYLDNTYIKDFDKYWNNIINNITESKEQNFCSIDVNLEIKILFSKLLPDREIRMCDVMFINSKVYEILLKLKNLNSKDKILINETEKKRIEKLKDYLEDNTINSKDEINLETLSAKFSINRDKMQKSFKKIYGETIFAFYRRIKLERAFVLLKEDYKISDISQKIGYKNAKSFRTAFKNQYGILPSQIKKYK